MAQGKFQYSEESLNKITTDSEGKEILVPLTGSVSFIQLLFINMEQKIL